MLLLSFRTKSFDGRYCRILLDIPDVEMYQHCPQPEILGIQFGLCAPAMCTPEEITQLAQSNKFSSKS